MTTHASSCRSMPCHALSETNAHQTPSLGTIAHLRGYCSTLKRHGWSMFRLPASMCISPTPTEQDFVAIRNKHVGACLYIRREDLMVVAIQYASALPASHLSIYSAMMTPPHYP
ncbi:uncharacterized protein TrAtP1_012371 [Trichoderma atroviride]|uniref:uncharacterized protein n=1 Tax=Hypocrea atroviridis TaxID=63577 RepID=UPI00332588DA|nr:hypothetical protein TrAtP1_012371 [Trichoderma atroviride]